MNFSGNNDWTESWGDPYLGSVADDEVVDHNLDFLLISQYRGNPNHAG